VATGRLGAIGALCAADMGDVASLDRFQQIAPKVLIAQDGYVHAGQRIDRRDVVQTLRAGLRDVETTVIVPVCGAVPDDAIGWDDLHAPGAALATAQVPFDHPLWVVYSSGTTGNPKPIVHGHGGVLIEGAKQSLHMDVGPEDRFCWLTSSGWIMWNAQLVALGQGATLALFDGAPNHPDLSAVWRFAADERLTSLGAGAAFYASCLKAGLRPRDLCDLGALRTLGSTGSPLTADAYAWVYEAVKSDLWFAPL